MKKKKKSPKITAINKMWDDVVKLPLESNLVADTLYAVMGRPETKKEKDARLRRTRAEARRRSKLITMTVGEFEDKLAEASYD